MLLLPAVSRKTDREPVLSTWMILILAVLIAIPAGAHAQGSGRSSIGTGGNHIVQGYVFFPSGRRAEGPIQVRLESLQGGTISLTADNSGSFLFSSLSPGNYTVIVDAGENYEVAREAVFIDSDINLSRSGAIVPSASRRYSVMVHLQPKADSGDRAKAGVLDAHLAQVPENARKLYYKGVELARSGDTASAVESLKAAVNLYSRFPLALNELGVQYLKLGKPDKAVEALNSAVEIDPEAFSPRLNLGIALLEAKQFREAEAHLNEALKRNSTAPTPHLYLGLALVHLGNYQDAEKELLRAIEMGGNQMGLAHYYLGGLYWEKRDYRRAVEQLEEYLRLTPKAADAERVRATIKDLRARMN